MAVTFKDLLEEIYQVLPSTGEKGIAPIAVYDALNSAIDELSAESGIKNLMPERTESIEIDVNDEYALSGLDYQHIKTEHIRNEKGNRCDRKSRELLKTISSAGEKKYAQESEVIIVKPAIPSGAYSATISATPKTVVLAAYGESNIPDVGVKFYLSNCGDTKNDAVYTVKSAELGVDPFPLTITINDDEDFLGGDQETRGDVGFGLAYEIVYRHALPTFTSFAGASEIGIDEYFVPAIVHLTISNVAQAKDYGIETAISERYAAIYEKDVEGLVAIMSKKKQKQL